MWDGTTALRKGFEKRFHELSWCGREKERVGGGGTLDRPFVAPHILEMQTASWEEWGGEGYRGGKRIPRMRETCEL